MGDEQKLRRAATERHTLARRLALPEERAWGLERRLEAAADLS
jgi:hypothetical protein